MAGNTYLIGKVALSGNNHVIAPTAFYTAPSAVTAETSIYDISNVSFTLMTGMSIVVKFPVANTVANPKLRINSSEAADAIPIQVVAGTAAGITPETSWSANAFVTLTYDGTAWVMTDFPVWAKDLLKKNDAMVYMGTYTATSTQTIDANAFSNDPTATLDAKGYTYKVTGVTSTNKYFGTAVVENGDMIIVNTDLAPGTTQSNYDIIQNNIDIASLDHTHTVTAAGTISSGAPATVGGGNYTPEGTISTPTITVTETNTYITASATQGAVTDSTTYLTPTVSATQGSVSETNTYITASATQGAVTDSTTYLTPTVSATQGAVTPTDANFFNSASVTDGVLSFGSAAALTAVSVADPSVSVSLSKETTTSTGAVEILDGVTVADPTISLSQSATTSTGAVAALSGATAALDAAPTFTGTETELTFTGSQVTTSGWSLA